MGYEAELSMGSCDPASTTEDPGAQRTPGYVIRTDVLKRGSRAFINVCGNDGVGRPFYRDPKNLWTVPHGLAGPKEDPTGKRTDKCRVYDFVVHPSTLRMVEASASFRKAVNDLAVEGISKQFNVRLDKKHLAFPDMTYKGAVTNVSFVEKLAQISVEDCGNELNEFFSNESCKDMICFNEETDNGYSACLRDGKHAKTMDNEIEASKNGMSLMNGCFSDEKFIEHAEKSGPHVNLENMPSANRILENSVDVSNPDALKAVEDDENRSYTTKDEDSGCVLPGYESFQDKVSVTFIFDVRKVNGQDATLIFRSPQEILLKMVTSVENELPLRYQCCLKFGNKCRFVESSCRLDVAETNVVLTIAKAEKSQVTWHAYFIGTSFQHLDVRDLTTIDGLKRDLDALDMVSASPLGSFREDEMITKETKAEEKELEDVPGEIVVIHERRIPKLHGILKQRSMSESSDDLSSWSYSLDRLVGATTCSSDAESEEFEDGPVRFFRPCFKKSVSFSEQIDEAMFVVNQSVSQMHQALKNKRRRMRKREQKHELKEARRRVRSSSESCSTQDDQDFVSELLLSAEKRRAFMHGEKAAWDLKRNAIEGTSGGEFHDSGSESTSHTDEECTEKNTDIDIEENAFNEDVAEDGSCCTDVHKVCENLDGTRGETILELVPEKTSLETCGRTSSGGTPSLLVGGAKRNANLDDVVGDYTGGMLSYKIDPGTLHDDEAIASKYDESRESLENDEFSLRKSTVVVDGDHFAFKSRDDESGSSVESNGLKNNGDAFVVDDHPLTSIVNK